MPSCPRCETSVPSTAVICPTCRLELKAHGHPGMDLHRATDTTYLCDTCTYHQDDTCNFPKRPTATSCTLYQDLRIDRTQQQPVYQIPWWRKHAVWLALGILVLISLLITVL